MRKSIQHLVITLFLILYAFTNQSLAQERNNNLGIGVVVSRASQDLLFKYWVSSNISIQPSVGLSIVSPDEGESISNFRIGIGILGYGNGQISPFYGIRFSTNILSGGGETNNDIFIAGVFGMEYFFSEKFSVGGEFQLVVGLADDKFSPTGFSLGSTNYYTGQFVTCNFYF